MNLCNTLKNKEIDKKIKEFFKSVWRGIKSVVKTLFSNASVTSGTLIMIFFLLLAIFGPLILPYDGIGDPFNKFAAPSSQHWLGCDSQGLMLWQ